MKIFILEDEKILGVSMQEFLTDIGYEVTHMVNSESAFDSIYHKAYDLLLLDVNVHGKLNGFELLAALRKEKIETPAIFITSLNNIEDLTEGYTSGCCDYIRKPFELAELKLRVEQVIKTQCFASSEHIIQLSFDYKYDTKKMQLTLDDEVILLSKTETKLLELLIKNRGSVVTYEMFWEEVWGEWIEPTNIRVQVGSLRKKLANDFIKNARGVGYSIDL
ncbi:MAG: PUTATIVE TWO-COMPONENT REGULATOR [uncultured Sulfurovum sp.]|uniref:PUTATIVE TWO-COMPONENT REGULATOR n=1 Tax=uncultured Sulfurovum sp. TaxID=269237 RepID=A0A6S6T4Y9_9BACT|nr:MAG: PUTATIVE TWO-COMPONENT REGULATOR [uncultured Sulfurovum sp.]